MVGDKIRISVTLKELNGNLRTQGGDKLQVRIMNTKLDAFAPGYVTDHDNGSYTAVVPALWPGQSIISIHLQYPRELIRAFFYTKRQVHIILISAFLFLLLLVYDIGNNQSPTFDKQTQFVNPQLLNGQCSNLRHNTYHSDRLVSSCAHFMHTV